MAFLSAPPLVSDHAGMLSERRCRVTDLALFKFGVRLVESLDVDRRVSLGYSCTTA